MTLRAGPLLASRVTAQPVLTSEAGLPGVSVDDAHRAALGCVTAWMTPPESGMDAAATPPMENTAAATAAGDDEALSHEFPFTWRFGYANFLPSAGQVATLQSDCVRLGTRDQVWPAHLVSGS